MGAEIPDGAVLIARAIFNSSLWTMRNQDRILAITLIGLANWQDRKWFDGERDVVIRRGELVRSLDDLAEAAQLSVQNVRTSLSRLEKTGFLTRKPTRRYTHLTLCKYDFYQKMSNYSDTVSNRQLTRDQHDPNTTLTGTQHDPNNKQELQEGEEGKELCVEAKTSTPHEVPQELKEFELYARDPQLCGNWPKLVSAWGTAYPGVSIAKEIRSAHSWQLSDPRRQKTKQARFIDNWLRRAQDNANGRGSVASDFAMRRDASGPPKL